MFAGAGFHSLTTVVVDATEIGFRLSYCRQRYSSVERSPSTTVRIIANDAAFATSCASVFPIAVPIGPAKSLMPQQLKSL